VAKQLYTALFVKDFNSPRKNPRIFNDLRCEKSISRENNEG